MRLNAKDLRVAAEIKTGKKVTIAECLLITRIKRRNWQRFEYPDKHSQAKTIPYTAVKILCDHFGLNVDDFFPSAKR